MLASPVSLSADDGWSARQTLMVLAGITLLVVVLVPAVTAHVLAGRRAGTARGDKGEQK